LAAYFVRRLLLVPPVLFILLTALFFGMHVGPREPASIAGVDASEERRLSIGGDITFRAELVGDFRKWLPRTARGDLGYSTFYDRPVSAVIVERSKPTLLIATVSMLLALMTGVPIGVLAVKKRGTMFDRTVSAVVSLETAMPIFVAALLLTYLFASRTRWLPSSGYSAPEPGSLGWARYLVLPCGTLTLSMAIQVAGFTRFALLGAIDSGHARTARGKGATERTVLLSHGLRSVAAPIVSSFGPLIANSIAGLVVLERVFDIPGLGNLLVRAISRRDFPILQGTVLVFSISALLIYIVIDLLSALLDPRMRPA
jgi:peptide/nickel transport system permease protein